MPCLSRFDDQGNRYAANAGARPGARPFPIRGRTARRDARAGRRSHRDHGVGREPAGGRHRPDDDRHLARRGLARLLVRGLRPGADRLHLGQSRQLSQDPGVPRSSGSAATRWTRPTGPPAGESAPSWSIATITPADLTALGTLAGAGGWKVILGVNLKHYDPARAADEAAHAVSALGLVAAGDRDRQRTRPVLPVLRQHRAVLHRLPGLRRGPSPRPRRARRSRARTPPDPRPARSRAPSSRRRRAFPTPISWS